MAYISNADLEKIVDTNDAWISERTGIRERRFALEEEALTDIALPAARAALAEAGAERIRGHDGRHLLRSRFPPLVEGLHHEQAMAGHSWMLRALTEYYNWKKESDYINTLIQ